MIWLNDIKGTVFKVEAQDKVVKATLSTSEKKQDNTYENSSWFVAFVGNCKDKASKLQDKDRITVTKAKITNVYNKEHKKSYLNFTVFAFDCERLDKEPSIKDDFTEVDGIQEPLPF
jgi:transposase